MTLLNKIKLPLITIALLLCSAPAFSMQKLKKIFGKRDSAIQVEGAHEGVEDERNDGPPAGFNEKIFEKRQKELNCIHHDIIPDNEQALLILCEQVASEEGSIEKAYSEIKLILNYPISPNISNNDGKTPLHFVAQNKAALHTVKMLIKWDAKVNALDASHSTPLHYATAKGNSHVCKALLDAKADSSIQDKSGKSPADYAQKFPKILKMMGAGPEGQQISSSSSALAGKAFDDEGKLDDE